MSPILITGTIIVNLALVFYSVGIFIEQRRRRVTRVVVGFLTAGVVFDVVATGCMIAGSSSGPFTAHGLLGFSSLAAMLLETGFAWRHRLNHGDDEVPVWLHRYSRVAYGWWIVAYITGAILVMSKG
jgi:uncharacterized repeat protein (TIGR03987 family)